jgi:hypothetical protein
MDPVSMIVMAVVAGIAAGAKDSATDAVKDAYAGLKSLIRRRFGDNAVAEAALQHVEDQPGADHTALTQQLTAVGAGDDTELVKAAQALLRQLDPGGTQAGKYNVQVSGGKGVAIGEHQTVTMTFNDND